MWFLKKCYQNKTGHHSFINLTNLKEKHGFMILEKKIYSKIKFVIKLYKNIKIILLLVVDSTTCNS